MGYFHWLSVCFLVFLLPSQSSLSVYGANQTDYYNLVATLFDQGYRRTVRPTSIGEATYVYVGIFLLSVNLDERSQVLEASVILDLAWTDQYLQWNENQHNNITSILYPQQYLWLPDVVIANSVTTQSQLGYPEAAVLLFKEGIVNWQPTQVLKTSCDIDVTYYPFDTQSCSIIVSTKMSTFDEIDLDPDQIMPIDLSRYNPSGTWQLVSTAVESLPNAAGLTQLSFTIGMKRLKTYSVMNIILPVLFLSCTASMVFYLPSESGEKMGVSITVLLAYAVYLSIVSDNMPQTSLQVSVISVYLDILLGLTSVGVIAAVIVLHIHHKSDEHDIGPKTLFFTRKGRRFFGLCRWPDEPQATIPLDASFKRPPPKQSSDWDLPDFPDEEHKQETGVGHHRRQNTVTPSVHTLTDVKPELRSSKASLSKIAWGDKKEEEITWEKVAELVDYIVFTTLSVIIVVTTIIVLCILSFGPKVI